MNQINISRLLHNFSLFTIGFLLLILTSVVSADFSRDGDIVRDSVTGLEWQDDAIGDRIEWRDAIDHCEDYVSLGDHDEWRLPNINELKTIIDRSRTNPAIVSTFEHTSSGNYWSSTTSEDYHERAWRVGFNNGFVDYKSKSNSYRIRCVRDGD